MSEHDIAFELGYDIYRYAAEYLLTNNENEHVLEGYKAAQHQKLSHKPSDIFDRKWLSIRMRCLSNGRDVTITPEDLCDALEATKGKCPVTGEDLTYGTHEESDWSVDRVDNLEFYTPENIIILSARANLAKSDFDLTDMILSLAQYGDDDDPHLEQHQHLSMPEWFDMVAIFYNRLPLDRHLNYMEEISFKDPYLALTMVATSLYEAKGDDGLTRSLLAENTVKRGEIDKYRKIYRKRFMTLSRRFGESVDPITVVQSSDKLTDFTAHIISDIELNKTLDRAFFKDLMLTVKKSMPLSRARMVPVAPKEPLAL